MVHYDLSHKINQVGLCALCYFFIFKNAFNEGQLCARPVVGWQVECRMGACCSPGSAYLFLRELRIKGKEAFALWS